MDNTVSMKKQIPLSRFQFFGHILVMAFQCIVIGGIALYVVLEAGRLRRDVSELQGDVYKMQGEKIVTSGRSESISRRKRFVDMRSSLLSGKVTLKGYCFHYYIHTRKLICISLHCQ